MAVMKEFRDFINRGNVIDLAVGVVIGAAFGPIVATLVDGIIMPPIGLILGKVDFANIFVSLDGNHYDTLKAAQEKGAPVMAIGLFINAVIKFLITAFAVFMVVKAYNATRKKDEAAAPAPVEPPPTKEEVLLGEIRDLLKK